MIATPGQTIGPFFHGALRLAPDLVPPGQHGAIRLRGRVLDGRGEPVPDALVEIWQPAAGGWGRAATDAGGRYAFTVAEPRGAFLTMAVFARGLLDRLFTRVYPPEAAADPLLAALPPARRTTLVAARDVDGLVFDVVLQGPGETVFLRFP